MLTSPFLALFLSSSSPHPTLLCPFFLHYPHPHPTLLCPFLLHHPHPLPTLLCPFLLHRHPHPHPTIFYVFFLHRHQPHPTLPCPFFLHHPLPRPEPPLFLQGFNARTVAESLWVLATLRWEPGLHWMHEALTALAAKVQWLRAGEVAIAVWALSKLR